MNTTTIGAAGEERAANYLIQHGYKIIARNWKRRSCEIDIIARYGSTIHFIEVRYRSTAGQGDGFDSITHQKLKRMTYAALMWATWHDWAGEYNLGAISVNQDCIVYLESITF